VVIFDPNWNPAQDLQAQDRSFRYGQQRHVVVFRLLAAGSLEELVYSRQVYKQQLSNIAVSGKMEKRYFEGVQGCKEFQGELFGICNLFRDLSDKLFTSEIIELHEKQGEENGHSLSRKKEDLNEIGTYFLPATEANGTTSSGTDASEPKDTERLLTAKPVLSDLGILYAHRNEDIINSGPGSQGKNEVGMLQNDGIKQSRLPVMRRKSDAVCGKENTAATTKLRKKSQYSLLAQFMNMGEVEFSKWLMSATPAERERVLQDFKRKGKVSDG